MKLFDEVIVACDARGAEGAMVLRGLLESFRLHVHFYRLVQRRQALDFFGGDRPNCDYMVLHAHGTGDDYEPRIHFELVDQVDGDYQAAEGWESIDFDLTPGNVRDIVKKGRGTVLAGGCGAGRRPLAEAFLAAGFDAYIGATEPYVDADSAGLFTYGFFYFALSADRDFAPRVYSDREAVEQAARFDPGFKHGTRSYRYSGKRVGQD